MAITAGNTGSCLAAVMLSLSLSGCGLTQKVTDGTVAVTKSIFYRQVKTLHRTSARVKRLTAMPEVYRCPPWYAFIS